MTGGSPLDTSDPTKSWFLEIFITSLLLQLLVWLHEYPKCLRKNHGAVNLGALGRTRPSEQRAPPAQDSHVLGDNDICVMAS